MMSELGTTVYFDANIIIYAVEGFAELRDKTRYLLEALDKGDIIGVTSGLTVAEVLVKPLRLEDDHLVQTYSNLLQNSPVLHIVPIDRQILERAAHLRADTKLELPDAIHFATSEAAKCDSFLTNDFLFEPLRLRHGDFSRVKLLSKLELR